MAHLPSSSPRLPALPAAAWTAVLPTLLAMAATVLLLWPTWQEMVTIWLTSETYAHGMVVGPVVAWLVWRRRHLLAALPSRPSALGVTAVLAGLCLWVAGELGGVNAARQLAAVMLLPATVLAVHGARVAGSIAFPLVFLLFMVPMGEALLPVMMEHTADVTVLALRATGIPVYREGLHFAIPSGNWSVVEACSGLRYLIASVVLGTLYAYLSYRSPWRRGVFILAAFVVPVIANWARAYMIVMLGHLSGMTLAAGVDHLVYGWLFFGLVMGLLFWLGNRWREDNDPVHAPAGPVAHAPVARRATSRWGFALLPALLAALAVSGVGLLREAIVPLPVAEALGRSGLLVAQAPTGLPELKPAFQGDVGRVAGRLAEAPGTGVWMGYYARQHETGEMVNYGNVVFARDESPWRILSSRRIAPAGFPGEVERFAVEGPGGTRVVAWQWYQTGPSGGSASASGARTKIAGLLALLVGRGDHGLAWVLYAPDAPGVDERLAAAGARLHEAGRNALSGR